MIKNEKFWKPGNPIPQEENNKYKNKSKEIKINEITSPNENKPGLSKSVLSMKFMSRKLEEEAFTKEENKRRKIISKSLWTNNEKNQSLNESMEVICHEFNENEIYTTYPGRRSFGGFNPYVERMSNNNNNSGSGSVLDSSKSKKNNSNYSDNKGKREEEILENYENMVSLPRGPNQGMMKSTNQIKNSSHNRNNNNNNSNNSKNQKKNSDKKNKKN